MPQLECFPENLSASGVIQPMGSSKEFLCGQSFFQFFQVIRGNDIKLTPSSSRIHIIITIIIISSPTFGPSIAITLLY